MGNLFLVKTHCNDDSCTTETRSRDKQPRNYEHIVEDYQLVVPVLYAHTQHGNCGLDVTYDEIPILDDNAN